MTTSFLDVTILQDTVDVVLPFCSQFMRCQAEAREKREAIKSISAANCGGLCLRWCSDPCCSRTSSFCGCSFCNPQRDGVPTEAAQNLPKPANPTMPETIKSLAQVQAKLKRRLQQAPPRNRREIQGCADNADRERIQRHVALVFFWRMSE